MNAQADPVLAALLQKHPEQRGANAVGVVATALGELAEYRSRLVNHDWAFHYTDDFMSYHEAKHNLDELRRLQPYCDPDFAVWNAMAPEGFQRTRKLSQAELLAAMKALIDAATDTLDYSPKLRGAISDAYTAFVQAGGEQSHG